MTNEKEQLRDRIAEIVNAALVAWNTDMDTQYSEGEYTAQAIIDHLGLTIETHATDQSRNPHTRIISEWKRP